MIKPLGITTIIAIISCSCGDSRNELMHGLLIQRKSLERKIDSIELLNKHDSVMAVKHPGTTMSAEALQGIKFDIQRYDSLRQFKLKLVAVNFSIDSLAQMK